MGICAETFPGCKRDSSCQAPCSPTELASMMAAPASSIRYFRNQFYMLVGSGCGRVHLQLLLALIYFPFSCRFQTKFGECLLPFGSESFVIPPAVQECKG
jgi:hypothetical protein